MPSAVMPSAAILLSKVQKAVSRDGEAVPDPLGDMGAEGDAEAEGDSVGEPEAEADQLPE